MRRKAVHLIAAIAESLRFVAVVFLAFGAGALADPGVSNLLRYAAAPQLLFAAGFFFMWLDPPRYRSYRPLLAIGKAASAACFVPFAASLVRDAGLALALFVAAVDLASLSILAFVSPGAGEGREAAAGEPPIEGPAPRRDRGPGEIEQVEV